MTGWGSQSQISGTSYGSFGDELNVAGLQMKALPAMFELEPGDGVDGSRGGVDVKFAKDSFLMAFDGGRVAAQLDGDLFGWDLGRAKLENTGLFRRQRFYSISIFIHNPGPFTTTFTASRRPIS